MYKKNYNSIFWINFIILLFLFLSNFIFYYFEKVNNYKMQFLFYNLIIFTLFLLSNFLYKREYNKEKNEIKKLMNSQFINSDKIKKIFLKNFKYKENDEINNLFKNFLIRKNLVNKDYLELKNVFFKMVPEHFLNEVGETWVDRISLWMSFKKHLIVMFLDIIWFTTMAEKLPQDKALLLLNIYFDWIVEIIKKHGWNVDKFLWDWMMVVFDDINWDNVLLASLEIQDFIKKVQIKEINNKIEIWIWINSGEVILGTIWNKNRMEITLIWDVVNTASRLEWLTRINKEKILFSENFYKSLEYKNNFKINEIWFKELKWKKNKINIYWIN